MTTQQVLTMMASFGSVAFLIKAVLMLVGGDHGDGPSDADTDIHDHSDGDANDATVKSFLTLSTQTLFAFMMIGGLTGLTALNAELAYWKVVTLTVLGGLAGGLTSSIMMKALNRLNSIPERPFPAIGSIGVAYLPMERGREGQVMIVVNGRQELYEAYSNSGLIRAFEQVKVVNNENNRLIVESNTR